MSHTCNFYVGNGDSGEFCIYHDYDDELCKECLNDMIKLFKGYLKELSKKGENDG